MWLPPVVGAELVAVHVVGLLPAVVSPAGLLLQVVMKEERACEVAL